MKRLLPVLMVLMISLFSAGGSFAGGDDVASGVPVLLASGAVSGDDTAWDDELASETEDAMADAWDPIEPFNRAMFHFNDKLYFWLLKPVGQGYRAVVPTPARKGVKNFFRNLLTPVRLVNSLLQGRAESAGLEFSRFMINTTVGVLGFGDPAKDAIGKTPDGEDLGQTLGSYGIGNGFYVVWPVLGPSSLRDTVGFAGDSFLDPVSYVDPWGTRLGIRAYDAVNGTSLRIGEYEEFKDAAIEPYESMRDAYIQNRKKRIEE